MNKAGEYIKSRLEMNWRDKTSDRLTSKQAKEAVNLALEQVREKAHKKKYEDTPGHESCDMKDLDRIIDNEKP